MGKTVYLFTFFVSGILMLFGQRQGIDYQAVVYDNRSQSVSGKPNIVPNKEMIVRFTIKEAEEMLYQEEHLVKTDENGLFRAVIGQGVITKSSPYHEVEKLDHTTGLPYVEPTREISGLDWDGKPKTLIVEVSTDAPYKRFRLLETKELYYIHYGMHRNIIAEGYLRVKGKTLLNDTLNVNNGYSTTLTGPLTVEQTAYLQEGLVVDGNAQFNKGIYIYYTDDNNSRQAPLNLHSQSNGIEISTSSKVDGKIVYFEFKSNDKTVGSIVGQSSSEAYADPEYIFKTITQAVNTVTQVIKLVMAIAEPSPSDIAIETLNAILLAGDIVSYQTFFALNQGISFSSGAGDYAEWLPRLNADEKIYPGQVVGVYGGKITKVTENADQLMVVSFSPVVIGNVPKDDDKINEGCYVAFMGQVPVWVVGSVKKGDFIISQNNGSGLAIAVSPENFNIDMLNKVVGVAWEDSPIEDKKLVKIGVGLRTKDLYYVLLKNKQRIDELKSYVDQKKEELYISNMIIDNYLAQNNTTKK